MIQLGWSKELAKDQDSAKGQRVWPRMKINGDIG